jgi:putative flippase GtrA
MSIARGQNEIKESSIKKKHKFKTTIKLLNGQSHKGKLVGVSDTSLTIALKMTYDKGKAVYRFSEFYYYDIDEIKIKHSIPGKTILSTIVGITAGFVSGYSLASTTSNEAGIPLFITTLALGTAAGIGVPFIARKRYTFSINGSQNSYQQYMSYIILMINDDSNLNYVKQRNR